MGTKVARLCALLAICAFFITAYGQSDIHDMVTVFARKFFRNVIAKSGTENVVISPYAVQRLIMVALQAARGNIYAYMQRALGIECIGDVLADGLFKNYPNGFRHVDQIFHSTNTSLRIPYILIAKILFNVSPEEIDLSNPRSVAKQINSFVDTASKNIIRKYFNTSDIHNESSIYFINAVYFEGNWDLQFNKQRDRLGDFYEDGYKKFQIQHMYSTQYVNYGKLPFDATMIELPYRNTDEKLLIVIPDNRMDLPRVQTKAIDMNFPLILKRMRLSKVTMSIPYFTVDYRTELSKIQMTGLENLSMLFDPQVDLSNGFDKAPDSMVPRLFQRTYFDINHYGSNADTPQSNRKNPHVDASDFEGNTPEKFFIVDRPFLFILHTNGTVHFIGSIYKINQVGQTD